MAEAIPIRWLSTMDLSKTSKSSHGLTRKGHGKEGEMGLAHPGSPRMFLFRVFRVFRGSDSSPDWVAVNARVVLSGERYDLTI